MRTAIYTGVVTAVLLALPGRAHAWGDYGPVKVHGGIKIYCNVQCGPAAMPLAPWYLYFPANAQAAGPSGHYPNWPAQPVSSAFGYPPRAPGFMPPGYPPQGIQRTGLQQVGYYPQQTPGYWYGQ